MASRDSGSTRRPPRSGWAGGRLGSRGSERQELGIGGPFEGEAKTLNAAGATFPASLYQTWFDGYSKLTQVQVNY